MLWVYFFYGLICFNYINFVYFPSFWKHFLIKVVKITVHLTTCSCEEWYGKIPYTHHPFPPNGSLLHNHSTISQPGNWYWYNPSQISSVLHVLICMSSVLCSFILCVHLCNWHHNQCSEHCNHHKDALDSPFISMPTFLSHPCL